MQTTFIIAAGCMWHSHCCIHQHQSGVLGEREMLGMSINEQSISAEKRHYYSSSQGPFHNANNILMFFGGGGRGEIVETIIRSLRLGDSIVTVCGERGSGKTMLGLVLADRLKHRYNIIRYDLPNVSTGLMLRHLLIEICPQQADLISADQAIDGVTQELINQSVSCLSTALHGTSPGDKPYMLTVDTQADLDAATLQILNDLVQSQKNEEPGIQIMLFRRTEPGEQQGKTTHAISGDKTFNPAEDHYWLRRLTLNEISDYLRHHMMLFDFNQRDVFTREMAYFIADRSDGIFRSINTLARNAFMVAGLEDAEHVSMSHLLAAGLPARETQTDSHGFLWRHRSAMVGLLGFGVLLGMTLVIAFGR